MANPRVIKQLTLGEVRGILAEQIEKLRNGETTPANTNAISNATGKYLTSIRLELDYHKSIGKTPNMPDLLSSGDAEPPESNIAEFDKKKLG